MKVKELIEELQLFNPEKNIYGVMNLSSSPKIEKLEIIHAVIRDGELFLVLDKKGSG